MFNGQKTRCDSTKHSLGGIILLLAIKHKEKGAKEERVKKETKALPLHQNTPQDPLAIRTIVVSGLPSSADSKTLWKKFRKYAGAEKVEWPVKSENGEESDTGMF